MQIQLEPLTRDNFPIIRDWIDPHVFHIFRAPVDDTQLEKLLSKESGGVLAEIGMRAVDPETHNIVGLLHSVLDWQNDCAHIQQIVVDPVRRGKGYGSAILADFLQLCFDGHKLHRVQIFTEENNKAAMACYEKVGFQIDGLLRDRVKTEVGYLGTYVFSILSSELSPGTDS
ncbi:MAG: GNAT family N-acetyltransferase [candidate division Zixibacteria bacterium]|nr:GNAT family N-acetyltransferase [candidate division Zixibacteria bacterium]MBU1471057.1 GNAT family N-acetyltransferase [candidate division Zixibacteria bacterium]MBU2626735.1 GNAT family N-acetyltransferase [candidate division Zixibacteria bacterium]